MLGDALMIFLIACLALLAIHEIVRYRRAGRDSEGLPYPRRRLMRRLGSAALFIAVLLVTWFWRTGASPWAHMALLGLMLILMLLGLALLVRDLHETSRAVVTLSAELERKTADELRQLLRPVEPGRSSPSPPVPPPGENDASPPAS